MRLIKHISLIFQILLVWYLLAGNGSSKSVACGYFTPLLAWWGGQMVANIMSLWLIICNFLKVWITRPQKQSYCSQNQAGPLEMSSTTPFAQSRLSYSNSLLRSASNCMWNISRDRGYSTSQSKLFHCSASCTLKFFYFMLKHNFLWFGMCPLPLVLSLDVTEKRLPLPNEIFTHTDIRFPSQVFPSASWKSQLSQLLPA